jgi:hypothetical protein
VAGHVGREGLAAGAAPFQRELHLVELALGAPDQHHSRAEFKAANLKPE